MINKIELTVVGGSIKEPYLKGSREINFTKIN